jgi:hypothetical protein
VALIEAGLSALKGEPDDAQKAWIKAEQTRGENGYPRSELEKRVIDELLKPLTAGGAPSVAETATAT